MQYSTCSRYVQYRIHKLANRRNIQQKYSILTSELAWDYFIVIGNSLKPLIRAEFHSIIASVTHAAHWRCSSATSLFLLSYLLPAYINKKSPTRFPHPAHSCLHCTVLKADPSPRLTRGDNKTLFSACRFHVVPEHLSARNSSRLSPWTAPHQCVNASPFTSYSNVQPSPLQAKAETLSLWVLAAAATSCISTFPPMTYKPGAQFSVASLVCLFPYHDWKHDFSHKRSLSCFSWPNSCMSLLCRPAFQNRTARWLCRQGQQMNSLQGQGEVKVVYKIRKNCQSKHYS